MNYGVIVANDVDALLMKIGRRRARHAVTWPAHSACRWINERTRAELTRTYGQCAYYSMSLAEIHAAIPHREPFLLIDEIVEQTRSGSFAARRFTGDEYFYAGHYPHFR